MLDFKSFSVTEVIQVYHISSIRVGCECIFYPKKIGSVYFIMTLT